MFDTPNSAVWKALVIGNTRLHWGLFKGKTLIAVQHTHHFASVEEAEAMVSSELFISEQAEVTQISNARSLWIASVVPAQTAICAEALGSGNWAEYRTAEYRTAEYRTAEYRTAEYRTVERSHIPLANLYTTLGLDRALNLLGAKDRIGWPVLVIDAGTALTFTAGCQQQGNAAIYGGAISPGIRLQADALGKGTAALTLAAKQSQDILAQPFLPTRWACNTADAIASGLIYGVIATLSETLADWWQRFPSGQAVLTGGDGPQLHRFLQQKTPEVASRVSLDSDLMFYGMSAYRQSVLGLEPNSPGA